MSIGSLSKAACKNNDKLFGGYFVFADNITVNGGMSEFIDRTKTDFNGNGSQGFCGVIDGRGYVTMTQSLPEDAAKMSAITALWAKLLQNRIRGFIPNWHIWD